MMGIWKLLQAGDTGATETAALCRRAAHLFHHGSQPRFADDGEKKEYYSWAVYGPRHRATELFKREAERLEALRD